MTYLTNRNIAKFLRRMNRIKPFQAIAVVKNKHSCSKVNSMLFYVLALFFFISFKLNHILPFQYTKLQYIMQYIL